MSTGTGGGDGEGERIGREDERRIEELWSRWLADGSISQHEERELAAAAASDQRLREALARDQHLHGTLLALGRAAHDGPVFVRRFIERVAAEGDARAFVSSVERRMRAERLGDAPPAVRGRLGRWLGLIVLPLAGAAVTAVVLHVARREPPAHPVAATGRPSPPALAPVPVEPSREPKTEAPVAQLEAVRGSALLLADGQRAPALPGTALPAGAGVVTVGGSSRATVVFADRTRIELQGGAVLAQVSESGGRAGGKSAFLARGRIQLEVPPQGPERPLLVSTPHAEAVVYEAHALLAATASSTRLDVQRGRAQLGRLGGGAGQVSVGPSEYALVADGAEPTAPAVARGVALLVAGSAGLEAGDERVKQRLEALGYEVRVQAGGAPRGEDLRQATLIAISSSAWARDVDVHYSALAVPIIAWEPLLFDELGMTGSQPLQDQGAAISAAGEVVIENPGHPLAAGLSGTVKLLSFPKSQEAEDRLALRRMSYGVPGPQAVRIASWPGRPGRATLFAYERGASMPGLAAAPARRVGLFLHDLTATVMGPAGWALFDAAVAWCSGTR